MPDIGIGLAGANVIGGFFGGNDAEEAANLQHAGLMQEIEENRRQYNQNREDLAPWRNVGTEAMYTIGDMLGLTVDGRTPNAEVDSIMGDFTLEDFQADPGYQFRLNEGEKAINRAAASKGLLKSGGTMKDLLRYGQDYSSGEYSNAWNRDNAEKTRKFNFMSGAAGSGQAGVNTGVQAGNVLAGNIGNAMSSAGNVRAAGVMGKSNAINQGITNAFDTYSMSKMLSNPSDMFSKPTFTSHGGAGSAIPGYYG